MEFEINTGGYDLDAELARVQVEREILKPQYEEKYGVKLSNAEFVMVKHAEKEAAICENCKGLPCAKKSNKFFIPHVTVDEKLGLIFEQRLCPLEKVKRRQKGLDKKYGLAKIPEEYLGKSFANYDVDANNEKAVKLAQILIEKPEKGVYFYGGVGTGKTFLVSLMAQEILKRGREVVFTTIPTLSMQIRSTFKNTASFTESEILEKLYKVPTLILDDVGMEKPTRFISATLSNIFNERYNARLQTIITSNYPLKELEEILNNPTDGKSLDGTRFYDRCKQMCVPVELKGNSRRR